MDVIERLGRTIDRRWKEADHDTERFGEIATQELASARLHESIGLADLARWVAGGQALPTQSNSPFGDAQLHLYNRPRWYIEALLWANGKTGIHEHVFSGAFTVLCGRSFQAIYDFAEDHRVHDRFRLGTMSVARTDLLEPGAIETIRSGQRLSHAVVHLEAPTVTIVVRTVNDALDRDQFGYEPPCLIRHQIGPFEIEESVRLRTIRFLAHVRSPELGEVAALALEAGGLEHAFDLLRTVLSIDPALFEALYPRAVERFGSTIVRLRSVLLEGLRRQQLSAAIADPLRSASERLLLSLVLTHPSSDAVVRDFGRLAGVADAPEAVRALVGPLLDRIAAPAARRSLEALGRFLGPVRRTA